MHWLELRLKIARGFTLVQGRRVWRCSSAWDPSSGACGAPDAEGLLLTHMMSPT